MHPIPAELTTGPFLRSYAIDVGVTPKMLRGARFVQLHPRVYRLHDHEMSAADLVNAAQLALPNRVHLTGISRIQQLGLDYGPRLPVRFVVEGDHHLSIDGIFLHRTKKLPPRDTEGVSVEAAYVFYCAQARVVDAIKVGEWLLNQGHLDLAAMQELALAELWRPGSDEALWVLPHLVSDSWSLKESETRALLEFAGLPRPECNQPLDLGGGGPITDLLYRAQKTAIEFEGRHHQEDRDQYQVDLDRYEILRNREFRYVQVTDERLRHPRRVVGSVYRELVKGGYDGPPPVFGERWGQLFTRLSVILGPRSPRGRARSHAHGR